MGIKVGITGHTYGFGKHIFERCEELGYEVIGFSRSTGYDISTYPEHIFTENFDVLINNAEVDDAQERIALKAVARNIPCINIGSKITEAVVYSEPNIAKKKNKVALRDTCEDLGLIYLTWGFLEDHELIQENRHLIETITVDSAVNEVIDVLGTLS